MQSSVRANTKKSEIISIYLYLIKKYKMRIYDSYIAAGNVPLWYHLETHKDGNDKVKKFLTDFE